MTLARPEIMENVINIYKTEKSVKKIKFNVELQNLIESNRIVKAEMARELLVLGLSEEAVNRILKNPMHGAGLTNDESEA